MTSSIGNPTETAVEAGAPVSDTPTPNNARDDNEEMLGNDAALCELLADRLDAKPDNDGKADRLTAYALRLLAEKLYQDLSC